MLQLAIDDILLIGHGEIIIRCEVGVWRAHWVLQAHAGEHRTSDIWSQILGVEVRQHLVHVLIVQTESLLLLLCHRCWPCANLEVIREVAHKLDSWSDGIQTIVKSCTSNGKCAALATAHHKDIVFLRLIARNDEVDAAHYVHVGATIIIRVTFAKVIGKPVAILVGVRLTIVDYLSTNRQVQFYPSWVTIAIRAEVKSRDVSIAIITILGNDDWISTSCHWLGIIATNGYRVAVAIVNGIHLYEIHIAFRGRFLLYLGELIVRGYLCQIALCLVPEILEVCLSIGR